MGSYYKQIAARFRRQAAEAQRAKSVVDVYVGVDNS